ncbi:AraC family transcriptional regulator [Mesorhizobium sp. YR577]|uniref:helix-turn-helix domain-containing protein n=1 Tax=Mesorhizobium sp. YR577 TaxID=1884373 RepID=UPI0008EC0A84|nr:AraC family transcriptional regulator [Mesorhizobium sp. YR577]SFU23043.1 transcriptional regulator, AraC family [Mesorhizobium sp. YR577]
MRDLLKSIPDAWGSKFEAESGAVTRTRTGPNEIGFRAPSHMALVLLTPQPNREMALNSDRKSVFLAPVGTVEIVPANAELFARWRTPKENLLLAFAPDKLSTLAGLEFQTEDFEFRPPGEGHVDEKALLLASMIREEFQKGEPTNALYLDSLITVFSMYLLRNYSTLAEGPSHLSRGGLSSKVWRDVRDYIQANLDDELSVERLSIVAGLSPSHFLRAFRQTAGQPPHKYVLATRLEMAEQLVISTDFRLSIVAKLTGFSNHSHMTAAMRQHKSITPSALRRAHGIR